MNNVKDNTMFKRLLKYALPSKKLFITSAIFMIISVGIDCLIPLLVGWIMKIVGSKTFNVYLFVLAMIVFLILIGIIIIVSYFQNLFLQKAGQRIIYQVREEVFFKIENLSIAQINEVPVGKLVTRVTNDTQSLSDLYTNVLIGLIRNILQIIFVFIFMFIISKKLTIITLIVAPIILVLSLIFQKVSRKAYRNVRKNVSNVNAFLSENVSGMKITRCFMQEEKQLKGFIKCNKDLRNSSFKEILVFSFFRPMIYLLYISTVSFVIYYGAKDFLGGGITTYYIIYSFYLYIEKFFQPIQQLAEQFNIMQSAFASSERIFEVLDKESLIKDSENAIELEEIKGKIEFKNVYFAYTDDNWVLNDVSFVIYPGQTASFVGATGSGKTTILSLIVRNYDIQKGNIYIDDIDIKNIKIASLRRHFGQMLQDVFLFNGTIKDNITMFTDIPIEEVKKASQFVGADHLIEKLPNQYNEIVRERGNNFSTGERQLLSFARAIVFKPSIIILDEATSNIDTETEVIIQKSLKNISTIGTMLMVAHRLSTIQNSDIIFVMKKGQIIESGNHQSLLEKGGHYYNLYKLQYTKQ